MLVAIMIPGPVQGGNYSDFTYQPTCVPRPAGWGALDVYMTLLRHVGS